MGWVLEFLGYGVRGNAEEFGNMFQPSSTARPDKFRMVKLRH